MEAEFNLKVFEIAKKVQKLFYPNNHSKPDFVPKINPKLTSNAIIPFEDELWNRRLYELDEQLPKQYYFEFHDRNISEICDLNQGVQV